jgi:hypothetical protein
MDYIISKKELTEFAMYFTGTSNKDRAKELVKDFLKSKKSLKLIAEGHMLIDRDNAPIIYTFKEADHLTSSEKQRGSLYNIYAQFIKK